jgi:hypothetical protein
MLSTYLLGFGWFSLSDHLFVGDKLKLNLDACPRLHATAAKSEK